LLSRLSREWCDGYDEHPQAGVAELADAQDLKFCGSQDP
jgi:hypothetical protein